MRFCFNAAATLAFLLGTPATHHAIAQFGALPGVFGRSPRPTAYVAQAPSARQPAPLPEPAYESSPTAPANAYYNPDQIPTVEDPMTGGQQFDPHGISGFYVDGCDGGYGCETDCCETCGATGGGCGCCPPGWNLFGCSGGGQFFFTADYLYVRASFSEAVSYLEQDDSDPLFFRDVFHQLDFDYESSYRFGGGYRLCGCNDEIRFMFTRMSSSAADIAPSGVFLPYEVSSPPGGQTFVLGDVDVKTYDVSFAKQFQFGGACGCGDPCGCGDACGTCCPTWSVAWSGGFRFADVDSRRSFIAVDQFDTLTTRADAVMDFQGGGLRMGLEGRRYFWDALSVYLKGDISVLLGDIQLSAHRLVDNGTAIDVESLQTIEGRQIIPVTELEAGLTGQLTWSTSITAGYLFSAWHDLGFRDEFNFPTFMETRYDDANILGFDGFFARLEVAF
jgi:hypothetical protein